MLNPELDTMISERDSEGFSDNEGQDAGEEEKLNDIEAWSKFKALGGSFFNQK